MDKQHIIDEIKRTAKANGGKPLGIDRFYAETGIRRCDWLGKYWARWGDANKMQDMNQMNYRVLMRMSSLLKR